MAVKGALGLAEIQNATTAPTAVFDLYESEVRTYCRTFPVVFSRGEGSYLIGSNGRRWLDFLSGAGSLNYGHNHPALKRALLEYVAGDGVVNSLDLHTSAKEDFLSTLNNIILKPRNQNFKCQFCGPTGTNVVEAALKLARKCTKRSNIISFSSSYHGMSAGSMAVSASLRSRGSANGRVSDGVTFLPFDGFTGMKDEIVFIRKLLTTAGSGIAPPAAFIVELVQGEGGVNVASTPWVTELYSLAKELGALFIVDDIQAGCGRTGRFFSFEHHGITPDIVCLSKSISGLGLPMSLMLINPQFDIWEPGEHTGTFRGFTYSFVTAAEALRTFWATDQFAGEVATAAGQLRESLAALRERYPRQVSSVRQIGMFAGIRMASSELAHSVQRSCFSNDLIVEICGPGADTLKLLPPLTISPAELESGIGKLDVAFGQL